MLLFLFYTSNQFLLLIHLLIIIVVHELKRLLNSIFVSCHLITLRLFLSISLSSFLYITFSNLLLIVFSKIIVQKITCFRERINVPKQLFLEAHSQIGRASCRERVTMS